VDATMPLDNKILFLGLDDFYKMVVDSPSSQAL
jgi:hypothetical protein